MAASSHSVTAEVRLKRFLYTSNEEPRFITGDPEFHKAYSAEKVKSVSEILSSNNPELLLNIIEIVNSEGLVPNRETLFFVLALATTLITNHAITHKIYTTLQNITKGSEDLFKFLKFYTKFEKKFSSALNKVVGAYYFKKDPLALAEEVTKFKGLHSWTHKDLIKLSHYKCDSVCTRIVITYVLHGLAKAKLVAEGNTEATEIIALLSNASELKRCENEKRVSELITLLHCNLKQVPSFFHHSPTIWEALIPEMSVSELITYLPKFYKLGFLKVNSTIQNQIVGILNNAEIIKKSEINPIEIFIALKNFEKGGKPVDPKLALHLETQENEKKSEVKEAPKCPPIISGLNKAMQISFQNPKPTGRRIMIGVEMSKRMDNQCLTTKNISCLDAATILILTLLKCEKDVTVAVFNDTKISLVALERGITFNQVQVKLKQAKNGIVVLSSIFDWAMNKKKQIDVFINFFYHHWFLSIPRERRDKEKPLNLLNNYRKKMSLPHTKLISFSLSSPNLALADGSSNVLDICGFSKEVPKVVEAFSRGLFY
ncbi:hypothetical protein RN001_004881 [Aquatica leii]|uniref:TROVE domain-containing protein n=1 Tax=Aquatica leii TaxID=1421715 RepID=A0AAN7PB96_9COLE|nr:hypothetical protein RN001_004881 [Aquatica leii]